MNITPEIEQLAQIAEKPIWDGDLLSKEARDTLFKWDYIARKDGWNILTEDGVSACCALGILKP